MAAKSTMLFDVLANILTEKSEETYVKHIAADDCAAAAKFMVLRYLTMSSCEAVRNVVLENYVVLERMEEKLLYKWLLRNVPRQRSSFIRYIR